MTPGANFATNCTSVVDTGGKFAASVNDTVINDTGGKLATGVKLATRVNNTDGKQWEQYQATDALK
jgi:hypothetical protein